jgi:uncharacterized protein
MTNGGRDGMHKTSPNSTTASRTD